MKRTIIFVCVFALFCTVLSGCGSFRDDASVQTPMPTMDLIPEISPVLTPDMDDGVVTDRDGVIGDRDPAASASPSASPAASPTPSSSPAVSAKP